MREELIEVGTGEIDVDDVRARCERNRRHVTEINRRFAIEHDVKRLLADDADHDVRTSVQRARACMQLRRGDVRAEVGEDSTVAGRRHFRLHAP